MSYDALISLESSLSARLILNPLIKEEINRAAKKANTLLTCC